MAENKNDSNQTEDLGNAGCNCGANCQCGDKCNCNGGKKNYYRKGKRYEYRNQVGNGSLGWVGFCAFIGAAVYFVGQSHNFWEGVVGVLKAIVWPAFLIYQGLAGLHA